MQYEVPEKDLGARGHRDGGLGEWQAHEGSMPHHCDRAQSALAARALPAGNGPLDPLGDVGYFRLHAAAGQRSSEQGSYSLSIEQHSECIMKVVFHGH